MREIKFRAWIKKEYDQCGGFMLYDPDTEATDYFMVSNGTGFAVVYDEEWLKDDSYEIMQFTGLPDKNGKEIYEGDIISGGLKCESCVVSWDSTCGRFIARGNLYKVLGHKFRMFEIIGNIHQNPELLEDLS